MQNTFIVTNSFNWQEKNNKDVEIHYLEKGTVLQLIYKSSSDYREPYWQLNDFKSDEDVIIPAYLCERNMQSYFENYQIQFQNLDKTVLHFGQLLPGYNFIMDNNGTPEYYQRIDEYIDSQGKKYNAIKFLDVRRHQYWAIDEIQLYEHVDFHYFEQTTPVQGRLLRGDPFIPPSPIKINSYFLDYPQMLEIVDLSFRKISLMNELKKVAEEYKDHRDWNRDSYHEAESLTIDEFKQTVKDNLKQAQHDAIMKEIDKETEKFRQDLIKKAFKY